MIFLTTSRNKEITSVLNVDYLVKVIHELLNNDNSWQFKAVYDSYTVRVYTFSYPVADDYNKLI